MVEKKDTKQTKETKEEKKVKVPRLGYMDYFNGYTNIQVPKKNGKGTRIKRIYTANFFSHDLTDAEWIKTKVTYGILSFLSVVLVFAAALQNVPSNSAKGCVLFLGITVFCLLFLITWVIYFIFSGRLMTIWTKEKIHEGIYKWSLYGVLGLIGCTVGRFVYACFFAESGYLMETLGGFAFLAATVFVLSIHRIEDGMTFEEIYNEMEIEDNNYSW